VGGHGRDPGYPGPPAQIPAAALPHRAPALGRETAVRATDARFGVEEASVPQFGSSSPR
jgi:hypothetical protein